ncbi:hypothetical protein ACIQ1D_19635 [Lysinibacillus xylanilyticus]|uniref:hypothetical protein n=1 Tax=Lysinibacillus xylanilyticus TaxID=582475 RepID=UPI00380639FC
MANLITTTEYSEIKNKGMVVIRFEGNIRTMTYSGISYKTAIEYMMKTQSYNSKHLIFEMDNLPKGINLSDNSFEHFKQFIL